MNIDTVLIVKENYCIREVANEMVILAEDSDMIHNLDEIGTFIFKLIDGKNSIDDILTVLCNDYDVDAETAKTDLLAFLGELQEKDIVEELQD